MIIGEIRRYLRDNNAVRVSRSVRDLAYKALSAKDELSKKTVCDVSVEQIASYLGESAESVAAALEAIAEPVSIFDPVYSDGDDAMCVMDRISDENCNDGKWIESIALAEALKKLNEREKAIIDMRFFNGKTQMEVSEGIGISQAQVSRIEKSALEKLKRQM